MKISNVAKLIITTSILTLSSAYADVTPNVLDSSGKPVRDGQKECLQNLVSVSVPECEPQKRAAEAKAAAEALAAKAAADAAAAKAAAEAKLAAEAAALKAAEVPVRTPVKQTITLAAETLFDTDKAILKPAGLKSLNEAIAQMQGIEVESIVATGHTDSTASDAYNQKLSVRRADAVKTYLISKGIPAAKVSTVGKGESEPVADNKTKAGRTKNRRVEIEFKGLK